METRHNTQALEEALAQIIRRYDAKFLTLAPAIGAPSYPVMTSAISRSNWLGRAAAIALVIVAAAFAIRLINTTDHPMISQQDYSPSIEPPAPVPVTNSKTTLDTTPTKAENTKSDYVTTNFTIFKNTSVFAGGKSWDVTAGHAFATQEDQAKGQWQSAWCYFQGAKGKLSAQIILGNRSSVLSGQTTPDFDPNFVSDIGLSSSDIENLANKCPWLDGKSYQVSVAPFTPPPVQTGNSDEKIVEVPLTSGAAPQTDIQTSIAEAQDKNPVSETEIIGTDVPTTDISQRLLSVVGFDAPGDDLPNMPTRGISQGDCQNACQINQSCNLATYNAKYSACYLKSSVNRLKPYSAAVTFYRPFLSNKMIELSRSN